MEFVAGILLGVLAFAVEWVWVLFTLFIFIGVASVGYGKRGTAIFFQVIALALAAYAYYVPLLEVTQSFIPGVSGTALTVITVLIGLSLWVIAGVATALLEWVRNLRWCGQQFQEIKENAYGPGLKDAITTLGDLRDNSSNRRQGRTPVRVPAPDEDTSQDTLSFSLIRRLSRSELVKKLKNNADDSYSYERNFVSDTSDEALANLTIEEREAAIRRLLPPKAKHFKQLNIFNAAVWPLILLEWATFRFIKEAIDVLITRLSALFNRAGELAFGKIEL